MGPWSRNANKSGELWKMNEHHSWEKSTINGHVQRVTLVWMYYITAMYFLLVSFCGTIEDVYLDTCSTARHIITF